MRFHRNGAIAGCLALVAVLCVPAAWAASPGGEGRIETEIQHATEAAFQFEKEGRWADAANARGREGALLWMSGHRFRARDAWRRALESARRSGNSAVLAAAATGLAVSLSAPGERMEALALHAEAVSDARKTGDAALLVPALSNYGSALAVDAARHVEAEKALREALELAPVDRVTLRIQVLANLVRLAAERGDSRAMQRDLDRLEQLARIAPADSHVPQAVLAATQAVLQALGRRGQPELLAAVSRLLDVTGERIGRAGDARLASFEAGLRGRWHALAGREDDALAHLRTAIRLSQQSGAAELAFRWHWETGRVHIAGGRRDPAIASYRRSVESLKQVKRDLGTELGGAGLSFREVYGPLYYELADLLLQRATAERDGKAKGALLEEARAAAELTKAAELEDYFQDGCVAAQQARVKRVEAVAPDVAFIYPIILADRLELLVSHARGIEQFTVAVSRDKLVAEVREFRNWLEQPQTARYRRYARTLHQWLFEPLEPRLRELGITTIVTVPEGALRTIPFAALFDGKDFVVRRYAFATTPGLELTDPQRLKTAGQRILLNGLTEGVQGFDPLPNVGRELEAIRGVYPARALIDRDYSAAALEKELGGAPYSVVHIASHGQFDSDPKRSFLLTYDDRVNMDRLERLIAPSRFRDQPIELLTLSACQTAAGDDRAALGLAGVAIKAGARSALASLWFINDESTAVLMAEFYRALREPGMGKAAALRRAQLKLLDEKRYAHPAHWGAFLLIGNWL
ncbi:MAG: CHAT domain-containing protein [Betaproteobacteria bacterium]|nr:CHAT domain-containing protein [Betaproteobacteria bacterium]